MKIETGSLVAMTEYSIPNLFSNHMLYSWMPTLGFYSVRGYDFHG